VSISTHAAPSPRLNWRAALDLLDLWRARWTNRAPRHLPVLVIMVTDKCNLHCKMCGACDYSPGDHDMLSLEEWKAVIRSAARLRTRVLSITGGEALLRKDLFELIVYARAHGMAVHLNTNGLLLREKNVAALRETGLESVSISIESGDPAVHDHIRGKGTLEHTLAGLRRLRAAMPDLRIGLNCVINKYNLASLAHLPHLAQKEGVDQIKFAPIHTNLQHKDKPIEEYADMILTEADIPALEAELVRIQAAIAETGIESTSRAFFRGMSRLYRAPASNFYCFAGYAIAVIDAQGNLAACFDKDSGMNVRDTPLEVLWGSPEFHAHRQRVRHCDKACWDTTNAELSLRLHPLYFLRQPVQTFRLVQYYLHRARR
jgi:MoaA/NifB/PqqE/SkfB family radical SAM enzyme